MIKLFYIIFFYLFVFSIKSWGYYYLKPQGSLQSSLGNNGIALSKNEGAVSFNPASMIYLNGPTLSASASVLSLTQVKYDFTSNQSNLIQDKSDDPQFELSSGFISLYLKADDFTFALYAQNEVDFRINKYFEFSNSSFIGSQEINAETNINKLGFAAQTQISSWSLALAPIIYTSKNTQSNNSKTKSSLTSDSTVSFNSEKSQSTVLSIRLGSLFIHELFNWGLYIEPVGSKISNRRTKNSSSVTTNGTVEDKSNENESQITSPNRIGTGFLIHLPSNTDLVADYEVFQTSAGYDGESQIGKSSFTKVGIGAIYKSSNQLSYLAGINSSNYNTNSDTDKYSGIYISTGFEKISSYLKNQYNLFYSNLKSNSGSTISLFGLSISTSYSY